MLFLCKDPNEREKWHSPKSVKLKRNTSACCVAGKNLSSIFFKVFEKGRLYFLRVPCLYSHSGKPLTSGTSNFCVFLWFGHVVMHTYFWSVTAISDHITVYIQCKALHLLKVHPICHIVVCSLSLERSSASS